MEFITQLSIEALASLVIGLTSIFLIIWNSFIKPATTSDDQPIKLWYREEPPADIQYVKLHTSRIMPCNELLSILKETTVYTINRSAADDETPIILFNNKFVLSFIYTSICDEPAVHITVEKKRGFDFVSMMRSGTQLTVAFETVEEHQEFVEYITQIFAGFDDVLPGELVSALENPIPYWT